MPEARQVTESARMDSLLTPLGSLPSFQSLFETLLSGSPYALTACVLVFGIGVLAVFSLRRRLARESAKASAKRTRKTDSTPLKGLHLLQKLHPCEYTLFSDLYIPRHRGEGTTHLDHVVVSLFGVFVIQIEAGDGEINNPPGDSKWTRKSGRGSTTFVNPLNRNRFHVEAVANYLGLPIVCCHSVILFTGQVRFVEPPPAHAITDQIAAFIANQQRILLTTSQCTEALEIFKQIATPAQRETARRNYQSVKQHSFTPLTSQRRSRTA